MSLSFPDSPTAGDIFVAPSGVRYLYTGSKWTVIDSNSDSIVASQTITDYAYTATSGQTIFSGLDNNSKTLNFNPVDIVDVFLNGVKLVYTGDYTRGTNSVTLTRATAASDTIAIKVTSNDVLNLGDDTGFPVKVSITAPLNPVSGATWYDTTVGSYKIYDGTQWIEITGAAKTNRTIAMALIFG